MMEKVKHLRKELHENPELSGEEVETSRRIREFIKGNHDSQIVTGIGGNGLAVVYEFSAEGPVVMIRCELDALPIEEENTFDHKSRMAGISHKCGHDGHMSIIAGLALWLKERNLQKGKVILLFQPAEETGKGAHLVLNDPKFKELEPDFVFALHNIPGEKLHSVIKVEKAFSATVQSFAIKLQGKVAHASEPENGINPALAISALIREYDLFNIPDVKSENFTLLTPIHITMGSKAYGISAGEGEVHYTIRTWTEKRMEEVKKNILDSLSRVCGDQGLEFSIDWFDYFPATVNDETSNKIIARAAHKNKLDLVESLVPMKFGEDFGWFSKQYKTAMFGLGAGEDSPALHHSNYDFPDELLETGIKMFGAVIEEVMNQKS